MVVAVVVVTLAIALTWDAPIGGSDAPTGPPSYVGSRVCAQCHDRMYADWSTTPHARAVLEVDGRHELLHGDFVAPVYSDPTVTLDFAPDDVVLVHGTSVKQRYVDRDWRIRRVQWSYADRRWHPYNPDDWREHDWRRECAACHSVGYEATTNTWTEIGIGCEACHGPGSHHALATGIARVGTIANPAKMARAAADSVCGQCHTRGVADALGREYPVGFRPGAVLGSAHYTPVARDDPARWWPNGSAKAHRQQFLEWQDSAHARAGIGCTTCHDVHLAHRRASAASTTNASCVSCHPTVSVDPERGHAPIAGAPQHGDCIGCHFPATAKNALAWDSHSHAGFVPPRATISLGGGDVARQPNSCNLCHYHRDLQRPANRPEALQKALDDGLARLREGR